MRQRLLLGALIIAAISAFAVFLLRLGIPNVIGSGIAHTEKTAVSTLRTLHWAQGLFRSGNYLDLDEDDVGEFGSLLMVAAEEPLPSGRRLEASLLPNAGAELVDDILHYQGYCYRYELPEGVDERERRFVAHAWPRVSAAGSKVFCINQDEDILERIEPVSSFGCEQLPEDGSCPSAEAVDAGGTGWKRWRGKTSTLRVGAEP